MNLQGCVFLYLAATVCTGPTPPSLSGFPPRVQTFQCSGPSQTAPRPWLSSSSSPAPEEKTRQMTNVSFFYYFHLMTRTDTHGAHYLDQISVSSLFGRPPGLSPQSVYVVQRPLPHGRKVSTLVPQLVPVIRLETHTGVKQPQVNLLMLVRKQEKQRTYSQPWGLLTLLSPTLCRASPRWK